MKINSITVALLCIGIQSAIAGGSALTNSTDSKKAPSEDAVTLQTISVIAEKTDATNVGASTLDQDQISIRQATTVQTLLDALPGASVEGSPRVGGQTINIQGFGSLNTEHVQLMLDGAPKKFRKYQQGSLFLEPELLKAVEVEKGPHSSRNGNGGFGGVVNMETKDAKDLLEAGQTIGATVKAGFQTNNNTELYSGTGYAVGENSPFDILVNITRRRSGNLTDGNGDTFNYSGMNFLSGMVKLGYDFDNGHKVSLTQINGTDGSRVPWAAKGGLFDPSEFSDGNLYRRTVWRDTRDSNTIFKHQYTSPTLDWLNTDLTFSYTETKQHDTRPENASKYSGSNMGNESWTTYKNYFAELTNNQFVDTDVFSHDITYGVQYLQQKQEALMVDLSKKGKPDYNDGLFQPWYMPSGTQTALSAFVDDAISFGKLTITPSLRYDHVLNEGVENVAPIYNDPEAGHDYSDKVYRGLSPKISAFFQWTPNTAFFADYSYSMRAPTVRELYAVQSWRSKASASSRNLVPEKVFAARAGVTAHFNDLLSDQDRLQVRASVFDTRVKENIHIRLGEYSIDDPKKQTFRINQKGYTINGIEAELYYDTSRIFSSLNLTWMTSKYKGTPRDPNGPDVPVNEVPPPEVNMSVGYKLYEYNMRVGWQAKYAHKMEETAEDLDPKAPFYTLYKYSSSYMVNSLFWDWEPAQVKGLRLQLFAENIFDRQYKSYLSEAVPGIGRNVKVSATMKF